MKKILILLFAALLMNACGGNYEKGDIAYSLAEADYEMQGAQAIPSAETGGEALDVRENPEPGPKKIIRDGRMGLQVPELDAAKRRTDSLVNAFGAYYGREYYSDEYNGASVTLTIRIPEARYGQFVSTLESGGGKLLYKEISARDVTEEYLDIETRLANKRSYLERYRELLKRAGTIKEILEVEEQVRKLEEEIESAEGRLRYLDDRVGYSTLELKISTEYKYSPAPKNRFWEDLKQAFSGGWQAVVSLVLGLLYLWPLWIVAGILLFVFLRRRKRRRQNKK